MITTVRKILTGLCLPLTAVTLLSLSAAAQQKMPQTTKERIKGTPSIKTEHLRGTVVHVEGNTLVVRMSTGALRQFQVPESRRFQIDGRELTVHDLQPGTRLHATITRTTTPVTERTTTVGTGTVFYVSGPNVILTLPNGENKMYKVASSYRFDINGQKGTVADLRKGMKVSAEKIVEEPTTELSTDTVVVGQMPPKPKAEVAYAPAPVRTPATAAAPAPAPRPAPAPAAETRADRGEPPAKLPKTASPLPMMGILGFLFVGASLGLRKLRGL